MNIRIAEDADTHHFIDDADDIDYAVGFDVDACKKFGIHEVDDEIATIDDDVSIASREESDEFRVLRVSNLSGHVTLYVAGGKHKKPVQYEQERAFPRAAEQPVYTPKCPFCVGNEAKTPPDILTFGPDGKELPPCNNRCGGWLVRVFPNIFPMLICPFEFYGKAHHDALATIPHSIVARGVHANNKVKRDVHNPVCKQVDAEGVSEVLVESTVHNALLALQEPKNIRVLLHAIARRTQVLSKEKWAKQLLVFKQYGPLSGGSLVHPHTQITSLPLLPPAMEARLEFHMKFYKKHCKCITCYAAVEAFLPADLMSGENSMPELTPQRSVSILSVPGTVDHSPPQSMPASPASASALRSLSKSGSPTPSPLLGTPQPTPLSRERSSPLSRERSSQMSVTPKSSRLVHITEHFVVSVPYASGSQYSMTIAPRRHSPNFYDITPEEIDDLAFLLALLAQAIYHGLDDPSYNLFIRTGPCEDTLVLGGKTVQRPELDEFIHWILEFRPRFPADVGGFEIASGIRVVTGLPEDHAAELRSWVLDRLNDNVRPVESSTAPEELRKKIVRHSSKLRHKQSGISDGGKVAECILDHDISAHSSRKREGSKESQVSSMRRQESPVSSELTSPKTPHTIRTDPGDRKSVV